MIYCKPVCFEYNQTQLNLLEQSLKKFNNPEYSNIQTLFLSELGYDVNDGLRSGHIKQSDVTFLNQIVQNRHRNVHATPDSSEWYNQNKKDIDNFLQEYPGMLNILEYLDSLVFQSESTTVTARITPPSNGSNAVAGVPVNETVNTKFTFWSKLKRWWS